MIIENEVKLDFKDILFKPMRSTLASRSEVELERTIHFNGIGDWTGIPIISANMDTTGTFETAKVFSKYKMLTAIHKYYSEEQWVKFFSEMEWLDVYNYVIPTIGVKNPDELEFFDKYKNNFRFLCIDVANGYSESFSQFVSKVKGRFPDKIIIAGNVATGDMTQELILSGASIVKIGIGSGAACTTRLKAGVGIPQASAIIECANVAHGLGGHIISDGGIVYPADFSKALGLGADFVMAGGVFAGHDESGGELITVITTDGYEWDRGYKENFVEKEYKTFYGMSSKKANDQYNGGLKTYRSSEGRETKVPYRGPIETTIQDILGSIASTMTYIGARKLKDIPKCATFVRVTQQVNNPYGG